MELSTGLKIRKLVSWHGERERERERERTLSLVKCGWFCREGVCSETSQA